MYTIFANEINTCQTKNIYHKSCTSKNTIIISLIYKISRSGLNTTRWLLEKLTQ